MDQPLSMVIRARGRSGCFYSMDGISRCVLWRAMRP